MINFEDADQTVWELCGIRIILKRCREDPRVSSAGYVEQQNTDGSNIGCKRTGANGITATFYNLSKQDSTLIFLGQKVNLGMMVIEQKPA